MREGAPRRTDRRCHAVCRGSTRWHVRLCPWRGSHDVDLLLAFCATHARMYAAGTLAHWWT